MEIITTSTHPKLKQVRALRQRKHRETTQLYTVEGIYHVGEAVASNAPIEYLCYAPDRLVSRFARDLIEQLSALGLMCYPLSVEAFASIADKDNPQGILAVVRERRSTLDQLTPASCPWGVALVAPQDPGNVGAILRSMDAVGADGLLLLDGGADPYHPVAVRASMGALFWKPIVMTSFAEFVHWAKTHGYHVYGASAHGNADYRIVPYAQPAILLLGSEQKGLLPEQMAACEQVARMPMRGRVSSLNLAVAAGLMLYAMLEGQMAEGGKQ
jgi:TrmH family RNA methyltransferase